MVFKVKKWRSHFFTWYKSPERSKRDRLPPRIRYPTVKKHASKRKKTEKTPVPTHPIAI